MTRPAKRVHYRHETGITLMELMIASGLVTIILLGIGAFEVVQVRISQDVRRIAGAVAGDHRQRAALAMLHIASRLETADRVNRIAENDLQVRIPIGRNFDLAANYRWDQYRLDGSDLLYYAGGCGSVRTLSGDITALRFIYVDEAPPPPGSEPPNQDNNLLTFSLTWDDGAGRDQTFEGGVTLRGSAYTNVMTGLETPGVNVSPPPVGCT